jgi:hypothetical protein
MKVFRQKIGVRIFSFLMALHVLNLSIDTRDANPDCVPEDLSINDQETVFEFIMEYVLGYDNAVAEHDEQDSEDGGTLDFNKVKIYFAPAYKIEFAIAETIDKVFTEPKSHFSDHKVTPTSPPPKA